jgi:hypothetical protein
MLTGFIARNQFSFVSIVILQNMLKSAAQTQKQSNLAKLHEQSKYNLEQEIQNYKDEAQKQRKIIYQLEKERDRYINEASDLTQKVIDDVLHTQTPQQNLQTFCAYVQINKNISNNLVEKLRFSRDKLRKFRTAFWFLWNSFKFSLLSSFICTAAFHSLILFSHSLILFCHS